MSPAIRTTRRWLAAHSVTLLRISLGLVILGFGFLKFFPHVSPAEPLAARTVHALTFGLVSGRPAVVTTAAVETILGLILLTGKGLRTGLVLMAGWLIGIMAPVVLFFGDLFPGYVPTLEAQYVLKDIILATAGMVIAAQALGARYTVGADR
jgi:putative oxidoreductase